MMFRYSDLRRWVAAAPDITKAIVTAAAPATRFDGDDTTCGGRKSVATSLALRALGYDEAVGGPATPGDGAGESVE